MKTLTFENYTHYAERGIYYLEIYYPYKIDGERNPKFNAFGGYVLDFKNGLPKGLNHFLNLIIAKGIYDSPYTLVSVPPSDPARQGTHGTYLFIEFFIKKCNLKQVVNGKDCLIRTKKVDKSVGGTRFKKKHLESIEVKHTKLIEGKTVLLIDDVTTSGSSIIACKELLMGAGAKEVIMFALGQTG